MSQNISCGTLSSMKTAKNIAHTKNLISLALFMLVIKKPSEEISVKEICEKAGVSRMSFYRYYNKKDDIFVDFCDSRFEEFYDMYLSNKESYTPEEFTLNMFTFFRKYDRQLRILFSAGKQHLLMEQFVSYAKFLFMRNKDNRVKALYTNKVVGPFVAGGFFAVLASWLNDGMEETPEEINKMLFTAPEIIGLK